MTIAQMFGQSGVLALLGMGVVFGFLVLLIISITLLGKVVHALGMDKDPAKAAVAGAQATGQLDGGVVAAIGAAIKQYRKE
jgi:oxaloacetate decarboxylase gamma subunit